jgi:hypothetical protein
MFLLHVLSKESLACPSYAVFPICWVEKTVVAGIKLRGRSGPNLVLQEIFGFLQLLFKIVSSFQSPFKDGILTPGLPASVLLSFEGLVIAGWS